MIFIAKNEDGIPSWKLIQQNQKTVTRRLKPMPVGKDFAICPGRGKFAVCRGIVTSCIPHSSWIIKSSRYITEPYDAKQILENEAHKEGFKSWQGLMRWFGERAIDINQTYRIEFKIKN